MLSHVDRIEGVAFRVDCLQAEGYPLLSALSRVSEQLDMTLSVVADCHSAAMTGDYDVDLPAAELESDGYWYDVDPDPFDTNVDDWSEDFWR